MVSVVDCIVASSIVVISESFHNSLVILVSLALLGSIITHLPLPTQRLLSLLLGTWFRIVSHSEYNTMSSDAVAKNVATSVFHGVSGDVERLRSAVQVLQILIDDFSVVGMLGAKNIQYFADVSRTRTSAEERRSDNRSASSTLCESCMQGPVIRSRFFLCCSEL